MNKTLGSIISAAQRENAKAAINAILGPWVVDWTSPLASSETPTVITHFAFSYAHADPEIKEALLQVADSEIGIICEEYLDNGKTFDQWIAEWGLVRWDDEMED